MRHLDLFSGIGGFALAAQWAGYETVQFVEIEPFPCKVLQKHWPDVPVHDDIKTFNGKQYAETIDLLTGGFPCQPYSVAGLRKGKRDDRALWPEALRIVQEVKPDWCVFENVAGILSMGFRHYVSDLENEGYEVQCFIIPACATGAPHRRDRVWIVAHSGTARIWCLSGTSYYQGWRTSEGWGESIRQGNRSACTGGIDSTDSNATDSGSAGREECDTTTKPDGKGHCAGDFDEAFIADSLSINANNGGFRAGRISQLQKAKIRWKENWVDVATRLCRVDDGLPRRMDRGKRLKALGNAIVPQVAYEIIKAIREAE